MSISGFPNSSRLAVFGVVLLGAAACQGQEASQTATSGNAYLVEHADCAFFGPQRESFLAAVREKYQLSALTNQVTTRLAAVKTVTGRQGVRDAGGGSPTNLIDKNLFQAMQDAGVTPAGPTSDFEFIRRVTLDLTGRIPAPDRVTSFVADSSSDKRAKLVDELLGKAEWVDKWTMYFGDLYRNTAAKQSSGTNLFAEGRNAFYKWIKDGIANNRPYDQIARDVIAVQAPNTWDPKTGEANWTVLGRVTGGPVQDTQDQLTANVAETFLGLANLNCLLCHNGRGHLDTLNLWGAQTTRYQAWQMAAFLAHTPVPNIVRPDASKPNSYYWNVQDTLKKDYQLGSTTGNRPSRAPSDPKQMTVAPVYLFNGGTPKSGEDYRASLAREVTSDPQFARATVNYLWKEFFGRGIVEPANQFDPARQDPSNPPPDPWTVQPSNPQLLTALAQSFIDSGYDLKKLMRLITTSQAYQLSSRYDGDWNPQWEPLFARKLVRRLWAEEIHDAIAQSSGVVPAYKVYLGQDPNDVPGGVVTINWAMQFPETNSRFLAGIGSNGFLDAFLRGNRDDNLRRGEGSLSQALGLMNDSFVMNRVKTATSGAGSLVNSNLVNTNDVMTNNFYMAVLSRLPSDDERTAAVQLFQSGIDRKQAAEDLLWSLYNKVDFIFNY